MRDWQLLAVHHHHHQQHYHHHHDPCYCMPCAITECKSQAVPKHQAVVLMLVLCGLSCREHAITPYMLMVQGNDVAEEFYAVVQTLWKSVLLFVGHAQSA